MKIFITGNACAGKTTFSKELAKKINIQPIGLDQFVWAPGWKRQDKNFIHQNLSQIVKPSQWIIEGVSSYIMKQADIIIFIDIPISTAYWRAFKRTLKHLCKQRPELPENCPEIKILKELIIIIWTFHRKVRPTILLKLSALKAQKKIFHLTRQSELKNLLANF